MQSRRHAPKRKERVGSTGCKMKVLSYLFKSSQAVVSVIHRMSFYACCSLNLKPGSIGSPNSDWSLCHDRTAVNRGRKRPPIELPSLLFVFIDVDFLSMSIHVKLFLTIVPSQMKK